MYSAAKRMAVVRHESNDVTHSFKRLSSSRRCNQVSTWATLALDLCRCIGVGHNKDNRRHLFVISVTRVFEGMQLRIADDRPVIDRETNETIAPTAELLSCIVDALRWSLIYHRADCGAYTPLTWVTDVLQCYRTAKRSWRDEDDVVSAVPLTGDSTVHQTFLLILRLLETCLQRSLLTSETAAGDLRRLLTLLGRPELPPLPADLSMMALAARRATQRGERVSRVR